MTSARAKNILYCESNADGTIGGSFFSLLYLVSKIDKARFHPIVIFRKPHSLLNTFDENGIATIILERPRPFLLNTFFPKAPRVVCACFLPVQKIINFFIFFVLPGIRFALLLKKKKISLVHLNNSITKNHEWMLAALIAGVPCITHERGINESYSPMTRFFAKHLAAVICISKAVFTALHAQDVQMKRCEVIYNGIDPKSLRVTTDRADLYQRHALTPQHRIMGVLGNIKEWKGQETAIRALPKILKKFPDVLCFFVGDTSPRDLSYKDKLLQLSAELGVADHCVFTGHIDNVADYINLMAVVVHTSIKPEPFGRVLIEAMAMKKPVIATRAGAIPEIIDEGVTGLTFPPGDGDRLAACVIALLEDTEMAQQYGEHGYQRLVDHFHIDFNVKKTEQLYDTLLTC